MDRARISAADAAVQGVLSKLEVDAVGVVSLLDRKEVRLQQAATRLLPAAASVVVFAMEIYPEILQLAKPGKTMGLPSFTDFLDRTTDYLNGRLTKASYDVARASHKNGLKALPMPAVGCPSDGRFLEAVFSYKHAGQSAGLGYIGRSSLLITPKFGPRVRLACCLTEAVLEPTPAGPEACDGCNVCIDMCPSKALMLPDTEGPYMINKFACSAFRNASGGCSECMRLCPAGGSG